MKLLRPLLLAILLMTVSAVALAATLQPPDVVIDNGDMDLRPYSRFMSLNCETLQ